MRKRLEKSIENRAILYASRIISYIDKINERVMVMPQTVDQFNELNKFFN